MLSIDIRPIPLQTRDLIYDSFGGAIYASVPGSAGKIGNSITAIDPIKGTLGDSVFVGSEPGRLAKSDDGQYLYVILTGAASVRRYIIPKAQADIQWSLGPGRSANEIEVLPNNPGSVVLNVNDGATVFDEGIPRARRAGGGSIAVSSSEDTMYAYNNQSTEFGFRRLRIDETGIVERDTTGGLICCFNTYIKYQDGRIYSTHGEAIDPEPPSGPPLLVGTYAGVGFGSAVAPDSDNNRVYFLANNQLIEYRLATFTLVASYNLPSGGSSLIRWGDNGLAYQNGTQVFLITITDDEATGPTLRFGFGHSEFAALANAKQSVLHPLSHLHDTAPRLHTQLPPSVRPSLSVADETPPRDRESIFMYAAASSSAFALREEMAHVEFPVPIWQLSVEAVACLING